MESVYVPIMLFSLMEGVSLHVLSIVYLLMANVSVNKDS